jgi:hypothetical protein
MDNLNKSGERVAEKEETNFISLLKNPGSCVSMQRSSRRLSGS